MKKESAQDDTEEFDPFDVVTKMPPLNKNYQDPTHSSAHKNYQALNWDLYYDELFYLNDGTSILRAGTHGAIFFCIHGAGHSALSFATLAKQIKNFSTLIAYDLKGHGYSKKQFDSDFSIETLCSEATQTLREILKLFPDKNVVIMGHSLGGSIACRIVDTLTNHQKLDRVVGCIVIDVVEGTAIEALPFMNQIIANRPKHFDTVESAIKWCYTSCTIRKLQSARVSVPPQLTQYQKNGQKRWRWKVNLQQTQKYWMGWFKNLSNIFLGIHIPKILLTAEKERMDKQLTIAQMQGKFKLVIIHNVGHSVQEDDYKATAKVCYSMLKDFRIPLTLSQKAEKQLVGIANFHPNLLKY